MHKGGIKLNTINKETFKYIERELYDYEDTLILIKNIENDIIADQSIDYSTIKTSRTNVINNVTEDKAIRLITNKRYSKAINTIAAIDKAIKKLNEDEKKLYELKYIEQIHWKKIIATHLTISERNYYRMRRKIILAVAYELGMLA